MIPRLYGLVAVLAVAIGAWLYLTGRSHGAEACESRHTAALIEQTTKERKSDAKRDREKPVAADIARQLEWLRQYGSE